MDVNKDELTDVPKFSSTLIHPTLFLYPTKKTWLALGWSGNFDNRTGGNINAIEKNQYNSQVFYEKNIFTRHIFTLLSESRINPSLTISVKGSISIFNREETTNTSFFSGKQNNYYAEVSLLKRWHKHTIVAGINTTGDKFSPSISTPVAIGSFVNNVVGIFAQDSWQLLANTKVETGLRLDQHDSYGSFLLPRIAIFQRINKNWGSRAGFGMGYITPNALTPQLRDYAVFQLQPIAKNVTAEKSFAGNVEVNYKKSIGQEGSIFINQAFFITQINDPITGNESSNGNLYFTNQPKPLLTKGFDTYIQLHIPNWEFYIGYTYTEAVRKYLPQNQFVLYTPRNRAAATALFEIENKFRIGLEASYNGYQRREDYSKTPGYLFMAAMAEKKFGPQWSLVFNCENIFDERQSRYESLFTGQSNNPVFKTLWAPIDGRIINVSIRYQPFAKKE